MDLRSEIKKNLLQFVQRICDGPEDFGRAICLYGNTGESEFCADVEKAADSLMGLSQYEFTDVYENLRDVKPIKRGVLVAERILSIDARFNLRSMKESKGTELAAPEYVYAWAERTLENPYYTDLLSHMVQFGEKSVNKNGYLSGILFEARSLGYLLITDQYEFLPVRVEEILIPFPEGNELVLYKHVVLDEKGSYEDLKEFLEEIADMEMILKVAE